MSNFAKLTKKELIEKLETLQVEYRNVKDEANKNRINLDAMKSAYEGTEQENNRLNDQVLELDSKVKVAAEEVVTLAKEKQNLVTQIKGLHADIDGMSKQIAEKEQQLKSAGKMQRALFGTFILVLIVWIVILIRFAI